VSIRKLPDGRYQWRHRVDGRQVKKTFTRRADAVAHDSKIRADLARGIHVDMSSKVTVAEYFTEAMITSRVLRPATIKSRKAMLHVHLEPVPLGARPIVKVKPSEVQAWARSRAGVLAPATLRLYVNDLRGMFATAVLDGRIAANPVQPLRKLSLPPMDKPKVTPLSIGQVRAWADAAAPEVQAMIAVQAGLGLRVGELIALRVQDVDFLRREVHITEQLSPAGQRAPLKTANSRRVVPLPQVTAEALAGHIRQFPPGPDGFIFTPPGPALRRDGRRNGAGRPRRPTWRRQWQCRFYRDAATAAGLPEGTTSHDLRHHYASVLLDAGESVHAVAERLGDTPQMVLNVYGHLMADKEDSTRKAVDAAWQAAAGAAAEEGNRR
jgi:integrase